MKPVRSMGQKVKFSFQKRGSERWDTQFQDFAEVVFLRGAESVIAGRLEGKNTAILVVRRGPTSSLVDTNWRIKNSSSGTVFNIRSIIPSSDGGNLEFTCETGVPT
ncbi:head-tail adaptor protein [Rhodobacteraceae bacterium IMCC1335]